MASKKKLNRIKKSKLSESQIKKRKVRASSKDGIKVGIDEYEKALRKYTGDNAWHVSDITEHDKENVVYEFTNIYDDLYY